LRILRRRLQQTKDCAQAFSGFRRKTDTGMVPSAGWGVRFSRSGTEWFDKFKDLF